MKPRILEGALIADLSDDASQLKFPGDFIDFRRSIPARPADANALPISAVESKTLPRPGFYSLKSESETEHQKKPASKANTGRIC